MEKLLTYPNDQSSRGAAATAALIFFFTLSFSLSLSVLHGAKGDKLLTYPTTRAPAELLHFKACSRAIFFLLLPICRDPCLRKSLACSRSPLFGIK